MWAALLSVLRIVRLQGIRCAIRPATSHALSRLVAFQAHVLHLTHLVLLQRICKVPLNLLTRQSSQWHPIKTPASLSTTSSKNVRLSSFFAPPFPTCADMGVQGARGTARKNLRIRFWVVAGAQMHRTSTTVASPAKSCLHLPAEQALPR